MRAHKSAAFTMDRLFIYSIDLSRLLFHPIRV